MKPRTAKGSQKSSAAKIGPDEASKIVKQLAAKQKVKIKLTEEQMNSILKQWDEKNPKMPAEITFYVGRKSVVNLKVAAYRYRGDTCCV
jgi:hypothetical protein